LHYFQVVCTTQCFKSRTWIPGFHVSMRWILFRTVLVDIKTSATTTENIHIIMNIMVNVLAAYLYFSSCVYCVVYTRNDNAKIRIYWIAYFPKNSIDNTLIQILWLKLHAIYFLYSHYSFWIWKRYVTFAHVGSKKFKIKLFVFREIIQIFHYLK
jgi:hypothetical protein